jgi:cephalosporin-C deacetylase
MMPMVFKDLSQAELRNYRPASTRQPDFDQYWQEALAESAATPLDVDVQRVAYPVEGLRVARVYYRGGAEGRICGWLLVPEGARGAPGMVFYHGYSGGKGEVSDYLGWALQGYAVLAIDVRGQSGESTDHAAYPGGHVSGWLTMGILDPRRYYYRGVYLDCVRAVDVLAAQDGVDGARIGVSGVSQGGGLSVVAAALHPRVRLAMPSVPFLCHFGRAMEMAEGGPYPELSLYCNRFPRHAEQVERTLSYVDGMNLAPRITCPVLMTVGLRDGICPASTVYATFNAISAEPKELLVFPYGAHEVFTTEVETKFRWAHRHLRGVEL